MPTMINPPKISTLLIGWLRGGLSVELSVGLTWLIARYAFDTLGFGPLAPILILFGALWTVLITVQGLFDHALTVTPDAIVVRTWGGTLLGRPGRQFPLQRPRLAAARGGRPGGGLRGTWLWLVDPAGRRHRFAFTLIGYNRLTAAIEASLSPR